MKELHISKFSYARKADNSGAFAEGTKLMAIDGSTPALSLMEGSIAMFNDRNELLVDGTTLLILKDVKKVKFVMGRGFGKRVDIGKEFERVGTKVEYQIYGAPKKQVVVIGYDGTIGALNLPSPLIPTGNNSTGYSAVVELKRLNALDMINTKVDIHEVVIPSYIAAGTATQQKSYIIQKLVLSINNRNLSFAVASAIGGVGTETGLVLTACDWTDQFVVTVSGVLEYSDILTTYNSASTVAKDMILGCGRPIQMKEIERWALVEKGYTDKVTSSMWNTWNLPSDINIGDGCGYNVLTLWREDLPTGIGEIIKMVSSKPNIKIGFEGTLAGGVPTGAWTISNSNNSTTILDVLLPKVFGYGLYTDAVAVEPANDIV